MAKQQYSFVTQERIDEMRHLGWSDEKIKNYFFFIQSEGGPRNEDMTYKTAERVATVFGKNKFFAGLDFKQKVEKVKQSGLLNNPELVGKTFYNNRMGNVGENDGYDFRGRSFVQITGRDTYKKVGDALGIDLVKNPKILETDEAISWMASLQYIMLNDKNGKLGNTLEEMHSVIRPSTTLQDSKKRVRMLTTKEMNEIAKANSLNNSIQKLDSPKGTTPAKPKTEPKNRGSGSIMTPFDDDLNSGKISLGTWFEKNQQQQQMPPSETV